MIEEGCNYIILIGFAKASFATGILIGFIKASFPAMVLWRAI